MYFGFSLFPAVLHVVLKFIRLLSVLLALTNRAALLNETHKDMQYKNIYLSILFGVVVNKCEPPVQSSTHHFLG